MNFLDPKVHSYAVQRTAEVLAERGTLDDDRLRMNMLSSMPMCFNLFGMIRQSPAEQLRCVQQLFDPSASGVDLIESYLDLEVKNLDFTAVEWRGTLCS